MFIEMIDLLRCVNAHEDTWLVASFRNITNRIAVEGTLGCPVCAAEYEISGGVADFTLGQRTPGHEAEREPANRSPEDLATIVGAYLDATQPGATVVLGGMWAGAAQELAELADVRVIALNAPSEVRESERVALVRVAHRIPLAPDSVHGIALDSGFSAAMIAEALRVARPGGRVVGPSSIEPPALGLVRARDQSNWIVEKPMEVISLRRAKLAE